MHSTLTVNLQSNNTQKEVVLGLYSRILKRGQRGQLWASLTRRSQALLCLEEARAACCVHSQTEAGVCTVSLDRIRGSEGRVTDFDSNFNPLNCHTRDRWLGIANARLAGKVLPPVSLVQLGDQFFVRDGHHRVSVARALGQKTIQARVVVWQVTEPTPWKAVSSASGLALQPT